MNREYFLEWHKLSDTWSVLTRDGDGYLLQVSPWYKTKEEAVKKKNELEEA